MDLADLRARVEQVAVHSRGAYGGTRLSAVPGLSVYRSDVRTDFEASVYSPVVCLILQGRKETTIGGRHFEVGPGSCIIVSHDLPVEARVLEARPSAPFLSIVVGLDLEEMRSLEEEVEDAAAPPDPEAYAVGEADPILLGVLGRYLDLAQDEEGVRVLAPLVRRELHYRLLRARHGAMLRMLLRRDSYASHIARAIHRLRSEYRAPVAVPVLARAVGMSPSAFHKHFKAVTATTPLQYVKDLRLMEARRLLRSGEHSVSTAAFDVGYESPTQFSREFSRKFGVPPSAYRGGP